MLCEGVRLLQLLPVIKNNKIGEHDQSSYPQNIFDQDDCFFEGFIFFGIKKGVGGIALHII